METMEGYLCALSLKASDNNKKLTPLQQVGNAGWPKELTQKSLDPMFRLERGFPPHLEFFLQPPMTSPLLSKPDLKSRFLRVLASPVEAAKLTSYDSGRELLE